MLRLHTAKLWAAFWAAIGLACACSHALAIDLRIETRVYDATAEDAPPLNESVTCFHKGVVYDFRRADSRVTIFRPAVGDRPARFLLLDTDNEQYTEVSATQLEATMIKLRKWAAMQTDPFLQFTGAPEFDETFDDETGELSLTSDQLNYRLQTTPLKHKAIAGQLRAFLDGYAKLHTLLEAGLPPEPRIRVNESLYRRKVIPLQVELTEPNADEPSLRGEHEVAWVLSKRDLAQIDRATDQVASFAKVSNAQYRANMLAKNKASTHK